MTIPGVRTITSFLDGEDSPDISNPIHSTAVAEAYGFRAALVGGVTVYGWCVPAIVEALGEEWLSTGWVDVSFRRPVYPGDEMTATVAETATGFALEMTNGSGERCLVGLVGLGVAPFGAELHLPGRRSAEPRPASVPLLTLEDAPVGKDLRPMPVPFSVDDAHTYANILQRDGHPRWHGEHPQLHPGWLAARMTPMLHHSYDYKPAIHTRSQIQHMSVGYGGQTVTVTGHMVEAYALKGHHYAAVDGAIIGAEGVDIAHIRHTTIFRPAKRS